MVDPSQIQSFMPIISGALGGAASVGLFKGPIQTLEDWWYVQFGHNVSEQAALLKATKEANIEKLKLEILNNVPTIPSDQIQEPKLKILGPALEASKFYIDEDELRQMFAKIITSSFDKRKNDKIHSSFVEIIKQLDVLDAKILLDLKRYYVFTEGSMVPIMNLVQKMQTGGQRLIYPIIFLCDSSQDIQANASSIYNLARLGLIDIYEDRWLVDEESYNRIKDNQVIKQYIEQHENVEINKGCFNITTFGANFLECCV